MKLQAFFLCLLFLFFAQSLPVNAQSEKPALKIATIPLPPWGYKTPKGISTGITFEWANAIAKRMGRTSQNRILPMQRLFKEIEHGRSDFSIMLRTPYSQKVSVPIANIGTPFKVIVWPRKGITIKGYNGLNNLRLSMVRGMKVGKKFEDKKNLDITFSTDYAHSIRMFKARRVDAVIGTQVSLHYNAYQDGLKINEEFDAPFELARFQGWVQASQHFIEREGIEEIQKASLSLIKDGTFQQIYEKHIRYMPFLTD